MRKSIQKKLNLSPTRMSAFLDCRLKYKYLYVDKIGRFYYRPKPGNAFGGTLHRVLESLHRPGAETFSTEDLIENYRQSWVSVGFSSEEQEREFMAKGESILRSYHSAFLLSETKTVLTEKQVKWEMDDFTLSGRLDRMDEHPDGALEIIDYKSNLTSITEEAARSSLAMSIYQVIVRHLNPDRRVFASIYCLAGGVKVSAELSSEEHAVVEENARTVASSILGGEEYPPRRSESCPECDFYRLCAKQPWFEREELA